MDPNGAIEIAYPNDDNNNNNNTNNKMKKIIKRGRRPFSLGERESVGERIDFIFIFFSLRFFLRSMKMGL